MDASRLARVHRVRTIQLGLARAAEVRAQATLDGEAALSHRIRQLAEGVAPITQGADATGLAASAHYRERLQRSAEQAINRVRVAEAEAARHAAATRTAHRDQSAIEKLIARSQAELTRAEMRALEEQPAALNEKRHDTC